MDKFDLPNGCYDLPSGKLANVATCLEMRAAVLQPQLPWPDGVGLRRFGPENASDYRDVFRRVGQDLLWFSRLIIPLAELEAILAHPDVEAFVLERDGQPLGLLDLDFRERLDCELAFFGLVPQAVGSGLGKVLMAEAVRRAFGRNIDRLWVHTCSNDHPHALPFYVKAGFKPFKRMLEIHDDPRLSGHLSRDAAPQIPLLTD